MKTVTKVGLRGHVNVISVNDYLHISICIKYVDESPKSKRSAAFCSPPFVALELLSISDVSLCWGDCVIWMSKETAAPPACCQTPPRHKT